MAETTTITEALAELKTIEKRVAKKEQAILDVLGRQERFKDPHAKVEGGSSTVIAQERQGIKDLQERAIAIRSAIQGANRATRLTVLEVGRTVHDWLVWRREVAPKVQALLTKIRSGVAGIRSQAAQKQLAVNASDPKPDDVIINIDELALSNEIEALEQTLGTLDGKLSLLNATTTITV